MASSQQIGVFDSGVGGLTVWKYLIQTLPAESVIYLADSKHAPYGERSRDEIINFSVENTRFLLAKGAKLIVVACNTATGIAIQYLREHFDCPFVGMEPAVKPAAAKSKSGRIGVLATANTFEADHFKQTKNRFADHVEVMIAIGNGLVELVEDGQAKSETAKELLKKYVCPMVEQGIDQLVLGCTHYPFLIPSLKSFLPANINIIDPAPAVARQVERVAKQHELLNESKLKPQYDFYSTGNQVILNNLAAELMSKLRN